MIDACPHCDSTAGVYQEVTMRQVYHIGYGGKVLRAVDCARTVVLKVTKTVRCIACNKGFRWKPPTRSSQTPS